MIKNTTASISPLKVNFTPYALAKMSDGFFMASQNYKTGIPAINFFLYSVSIELGFKAAVLSRDNSQAKKNHLKKIGHDLEKGYVEFQKDFAVENLLDQYNINAIKKINLFYKNKGLEYFTTNTIVAHMNGLSSFPKLIDLENTSFKINRFLEKSKFFVNC